MSASAPDFISRNSCTVYKPSARLDWAMLWEMKSDKILRCLPEARLFRGLFKSEPECSCQVWFWSARDPRELIFMESNHIFLSFFSYQMRAVNWTYFACEFYWEHAYKEKYFIGPVDARSYGIHCRPSKDPGRTDGWNWLSEEFKITTIARSA